jgi:hypothetical protein
MIYRILAAAAVFTTAAVPGSARVTYLSPDTTHVRLDASSQFSPPFQMSGTWHLSEQLNPAPDNGTPPLANAPLTFTSGPGHSYYANDPCFTATWPDATGQVNTIVVSVFVSPRGLLLTGYRTAGTYQQSLARPRQCLGCRARVHADYQWYRYRRCRNPGGVEALYCFRHQDLRSQTSPTE